MKEETVRGMRRKRGEAVGERRNMSCEKELWKIKDEKKVQERCDGVRQYCTQEDFTDQT